MPKVGLGAVTIFDSTVGHCRIAELGRGQDCVGQVSVGEVGANQVRPRQIGLPQIGAAQVCRVKLCLLQVRPEQNGTV